MFCWWCCDGESGPLRWPPPWEWIACVLIALYPFARGRLQLRFCRPRFSLSMIKQIVACGSPNFLNNISGRITSILMNAVLLRVGGQNAVSIYGILMYADGLIQPLLYGACDSLQPAVSYNWGGRGPEAHLGH